MDYLRAVRRLLLQGVSLPAILAYNVMNASPVRKRLDEQRALAIADHAARLPALSAMEADIVEKLARDGVAVTTLAALDVRETEAMFRAARAVGASLAWRCSSFSAATRAFIEAGRSDLMHHPEIYRWGLNDRVLRIVENYLGLPVGYDGLRYYYSPANGREVRTRLWHRDREDLRMVKVAIFVSDVGEEGGPFQILRHEFHAERLGAQPLAFAILSQRDLEDCLGRDGARAVTTTCTGPAGTVVFADTARFHHRGKPPTAQDRSAIFFSYFARQPRHPFLCERSRLARADIEVLAGSLPRHQRDCALWRDCVPRPWRWIPPSAY